jgi:signal transduction histidine kinase
LSGTGYSVVENDVRVRDRMYRIARGPLQVGNETLGVFAVALPSHFIAQARAVNRNIYTAIFTVAMAAVVLVGYLISRRITSPLTRLVRATKAVAEGHLDQRTGIESSDEIGTLAETFDDMTGKLSDRTRALEEAIGRMRAILSSIGDGVVLEDLEGKLNPLNAAAETLLDEMSANFMLGPLQELSAGEYDQATEIQPSPWLLERRRFQVGKKVVSAHSASVRTDDDERLGTVIVLRDVTAEVEAERLKDAFITHVSHELRTPLTAVKGYVDLLLVGAAGALDEEQMGFLDTISRHTDNLVAMINELLDFSEMEAGGRLGLRPRPVLLSTLVEEIADELRPQVDEKGLTLTVELPDELPLVDADTRRLRWAVINLVRNAWQYTPAGGVVTLRLLQRDGQVKLDVVDTGIGISPEDQKNLFTRFYRVTNVTKDDVRGLGLGLYVAKAIVEAHGGQIEVVSEEGVGSTFSVILPALKDRQVEKSTN